MSIQNGGDIILVFLIAKYEKICDAANINLGILALKEFVEALWLNMKKPKAHVSYADGKLTMILAPGLGGDGNTCVIL